MRNTHTRTGVHTPVRVSQAEIASRPSAASQNTPTTERSIVAFRPSSAKGNYTPPAIIRKVFGQIKQRCDSANRDREIRAANVTNPGYLKSRIPIVKFGVQLATDGRDSIAQMLPAIDLAIEKVTTMPAYRGVVFRVVPILYFDWLACDSLAILEKFNRREVNVIFGPINDFVLGAAARFSTALYLVPIVSPAASSVQLADKNEFGMLTRMYFTYADLEWVVASTLIHFGWEPKISTPIAMITVQPITISDAFNAGWDSFFQQQAISTVLINYKRHRYHVERGADEIRNIFKELPKVARTNVALLSFLALWSELARPFCRFLCFRKTPSLEGPASVTNLV
ncbi:hypothetical protein TSMEX_009118 [Taenia solium]|eukprot:TsM_000443900 transcript=TsM_000443900 gene=TsM_000443900